MTEPERNLWRAVLLQAVMDATAITTRKKGDSGCTVTDYERARARKWLTEENNGFVKVCGYAGVCPRLTRQKALALARDGWERMWGDMRRRHETNCVA